jgi:hypothetical protein
VLHKDSEHCILSCKSQWEKEVLMQFDDFFYCAFALMILGNLCIKKIGHLHFLLGYLCRDFHVVVI